MRQTFRRRNPKTKSWTEKVAAWVEVRSCPFLLFFQPKDLRVEKMVLPLTGTHKG